MSRTRADFLLKWLQSWMMTGRGNPPATDDDPDDPRCPCCGSRSKLKTGECAFCGVHVCARCGQWHLGPVEGSKC